MRSPKDMQVIQIDITNACIHSCSNCTRLCGHHKKPFFMDWEMFQRAVDSLEGYQGTVGIMGGEPTLHPDFERFARYLAKKNPYKKEDSIFLKPSRDFMRSLCEEETGKMTIYHTPQGDKTTISGPGLWSSMNKRYFENFELIHDTFRHQMVNDHSASSMHQPVLVTRKEMGIPDEEWYVLRDKCWIQNEWSATITPKGAFFCEVAGALDMLFDGPGGWPVEAGWWKREPGDFKDQLSWCELCGMALNTCTRDANEEIDDISPMMYERMKNRHSGKLRQGKYHVLNIGQGGKIAETGRGKMKKNIYLEDYQMRVDKEKTVLYPKGFEGIVFYQEEIPVQPFLEKLKENRNQLDRIAVIFNNSETMKVFQKEKCKIEGESGIINSVCEILNTEKRFGTGINRAMGLLGKESYLVLFTPDVCLAEHFKDTLTKFVINPGTILYRQGNDTRTVSLMKEMKDETRKKEAWLALFHRGAYALRLVGFDRISQTEDIVSFIHLWEERKRLLLSDELFLEEKPFVKPDGSYIVYGTSRGGKNTSDYITLHGGKIIAYADSSEDKWGDFMEGKKILSPALVKEQIPYIDAVIIASSYFSEIKPMLLKEGIPEDKIIISTATF